MNTDFHKIRRLPPYVFEQVNRTKAALRADGADIIDLGMGNPDLPTPKHIVDKLCETARRPDVNGYSASRGIPGLRRALTDYYKRRFDVTLDKDREVIVTLGSKEGFANLAQAISAPGDVILAPDPSYPLHHFGFIIAGASIRGVPAQTPEQYLSNLGKAVHYSTPPPTAMVLCYPSNPTAAVCDLDFYKEAIKFAKKHELWVLSDLAYNEIYFDEPTPDPSGRWSEGHRGRVHDHVEDLFHGRLAHGLRRRERDADFGARPREVLSRLRCLHADPGGGCGRARWPAGLCGRDARDLQITPRRAGGKFHARRLAGAEPGGVDVCLGAYPGTAEASR